ncbi:LOW QUALITY PROTEIN: Fc receptor-like protein 3 [Agelaius phoeniceus]|uniref:LOW QUALITY PROTEIN: Fc receptor-like protein 3 n=1 Tax=Agelaius phoeniceus TaxID=39638 RepID=UPI004054C7A3
MSNRVTVTVHSPLSFSWHRKVSGALLGTGPHLELSHTGDNDSGQYRCRVSDGDSVAESDPMNVTVLVPVANATIIPGPLAHQGYAGDNVTLHCSVQCMATNQLGQDGHRVFRALSPELALEDLTCQGSGTAGATTWYKDGQRWGQQGSDRLSVTESGTYTCVRPGTGHSPPIRVLDDPLVLQVPARALLEGDTVTLRCRSWQNKPLTDVYFYHDGKKLQGLHDGSELSLSPLRLHHSGRYHCTGRVVSQWRESEQVTVTVHRVPLLGVSLSAQPPRGQVALGDSLVLSCTVAVGTGPLSFSWHEQGSWAPLGSAPCLELHHIGDNDSGQYRCHVSDGDSVAESDPLNVTVLAEQDPWDGVPMANATITPGPLSHQVHAGDNVTLHCSVQVGSAPVTFTWLHNGQEVAQGPLLEIGDVNVGHSGTYQCVATNQLGQDGHRVFRALSPELALEVTPWVSGRVPQAVAVNVGRNLLFLLLLLAVIGGCHWWHHRGPPVEEGAVLNTHIMGTEWAEGEFGGDKDTSPTGVTPPLTQPKGRSSPIVLLHDVTNVTAAPRALPSLWDKPKSIRVIIRDLIQELM